MKFPKLASIRVLRKVFLWTLGCLVVFTLVGFLVMPLVLRSVLASQLTARLHREIRIKEIWFNPFMLSLEINGFSIKDREGGEPFVSFAELALNFQAASVFKEGPVLRDILLRTPHVTIIRNEDLTYNFSDLLEEFTAKPAPDAAPPPEAKPFRYSLNNIRIESGSIDFQDRPKHVQHAVRDINIGIPFLSNLSYDVNLYVQPAFEAKVNGTPIVLTGKTKPFSDPREAVLEVDVSNVEIPKYMEYVPAELRFRIPSGGLDTKLSLLFTQYKDKPPALIVAGKVALNKLSVTDVNDRSVLDLPLLDIAIDSLDVFAKKVSLATILLQAPEVHLWRDKTGILNVTTLAPVEQGGNSAAENKPQSDQAEGTPLSIEAAEVRLADGKVTFADESTEEPFQTTVEAVNVVVRHFSNAPTKPSAVEVSLTTENKTGTFAVEGPIAVSPLSAALKVDAKGIDLVPLQPYFTDKVKVTVTSGAVSASGNLTLQATQENDIKAAFTGQASVAKFATVDKAKAEDFLKWKSLYLSGVNAGNNPFHVEINEVALTDFYSRLIINPDATLNVQGIVKSGPQTPEKVEAKESVSNTAVAQKPEEVKPIKIGKVTLQGGNINFSDRFIKPNYSANLVQVGGRISGLSSEQNKQADVDLRGRLDNSAPLEITGKINPFSKDLYVDLTVDFKDIDLSPMTPYAGKYAGYTIEKGKLSLSLKYLIENRKLSAQNKVFLDQFTLGDKTDSPNATKLPVRLAVSLLKDRNGAIKLDLPMAGSLDDPQFSVWGVIVQIITNILTKAATAPLALLGAAFGGSGGEELSSLEFDYGRFNLDGAAEEKLKTLATALADRPTLKLGMSGYVDAEKDMEGLKQYRFERKLKAQKLNNTEKKGGADVSLDDIKIEPDEYSKYLALAYKKETFPKPRNILGFAKDLPDPEMEKLILTHIEVTDDDLGELAKQRAEAVEGYLLQTGQIAPERIFLVEPETPSPEKKDNLKGSRVDFTIQ